MKIVSVVDIGLRREGKSNGKTSFLGKYVLIPQAEVPNYNAYLSIEYSELSVRKWIG